MKYLQSIIVVSMLFTGCTMLLGSASARRHAISQNHGDSVLKMKPTDLTTISVRRGQLLCTAGLLLGTALLMSDNKALGLMVLTASLYYYSVLVAARKGPQGRLPGPLHTFLGIPTAEVCWNEQALKKLFSAPYPPISQNIKCGMLAKLILENKPLDKRFIDLIIGDYDVSGKPQFAWDTYKEIPNISQMRYTTLVDILGLENVRSLEDHLVNTLKRYN